MSTSSTPLYFEKYIEANSGLSVETIEAPDFITIIKNSAKERPTSHS